MAWFKPDKEFTHWQEICNNINYMINNGYHHKIIIGTDSQTVAKKTVVVVALCIVSDMPGFEKIFYYSKEKVDKFKDLHSRVAYETQKSIEVANSLKQYTTSLLDNLNIAIHLDVSSDKSKEKTSRYSNGLISLVRACDYPHVEVKPNSWAASSVAHKYTKG
jgi:predicted RNase H-related nuclease YkuK (DUF458 family)